MKNNVLCKLWFVTLISFLLSCRGCCGNYEEGEPIIKKHLGTRVEPKEVLAKLPDDVQKLDRLVIGTVKYPFVKNPDNYETIIVEGKEVLIDQETGNAFVKADGFNDNISTTIEEYCKIKNLKGGSISSDRKEIGTLQIKKDDVTVDIIQDPFGVPDINGSAWGPVTIEEIKNTHPQLFGAIVFERVGIMPLYWGDYLKKLCENSNHKFYKIPKPFSVEGYQYYCQSRNYIKALYDQGYHFYNPTKDAVLPDNPYSKYSNKEEGQYPDSSLVFVIEPKEGEFECGNTVSIHNFKDIIEAIKPNETNILKAYYDLLMPGGALIFMSSSSAINRHGGLIFKYQDELYSPFKDLDDANMQSIYRSVFERAGFKSVNFYKDACYTEDVIFTVAEK